MTTRSPNCKRRSTRLTGGETSELGQAIQRLQVAIELNNDRLLEAAKEEEEEAQEFTALDEQLGEAKTELSVFKSSLESANAALAEALQQLEDARAEEQEVRAALATAGEKNEHLSEALASAEALVGEHEEQRAEAQSEVDKLAVEADLVGQQLADAQEESEEIRLALGELDIKLQELAEDAPEYDVKLLRANSQRHSEQRPNFPKTEPESKSGCEKQNERSTSPKPRWNRNRVRRDSPAVPAPCWPATIRR